VSACGRDDTLWLEAAMAKLVTSELAEDVAVAAMELLGLEATAGPFDHALRLAPMYVIGGGTADIQRNLIARGLGLPAR
jgi:alkylation response protein AidB-like acyl-CoA dehydrogenase